MMSLIIFHRKTSLELTSSKGHWLQVHGQVNIWIGKRSSVDTPDRHLYVDRKVNLGYFCREKGASAMKLTRTMYNKLIIESNLNMFVLIVNKVYNIC